MIGYKAFDKNFCCRDFQFEVGKTYKHDGDLKICESGFHFCLEPLAVFQYYLPANGNRYALVEATGKIIFAQDETYKATTDEIKIVKELSLDELIATVSKKDAHNNTDDYSVATNTGCKSVATNTGDYSAATNTGNLSAAINTAECRSAATNTGNCSAATNTANCSTATNTGDYSVATNTGDYSAATTTGDYSVATNTGDYSVATTTGDCSAATNTGDYSAAINTGNYSTAIVSGSDAVALVTGKDSKAKGALGCWLVLCEWDGGNLIDVQAFKVDGEIIKPDTFYCLVEGKPVVVYD